MRHEQRNLNTPQWNRIKGTHHRGMRIEGRVWRKLAGGYLVQAGRGRRLVLGFLSDAELQQACLVAGVESPKYQEGDIVYAFVQDYDDKHSRLVLSPREVDRHTVTRFLESVKTDDKLIGRVIDHATAGVFIRLDNGFDALLPRSEIPDLANRSIEDVLRLGDQVAGVVIHKDIPARHLHLSVTKYLSAGGAQPAFSSNAQVANEPRVELALGEEYHVIPRAERPRRVAVLDDDQDNLLVLGSFLLGCGHHVHTSDTLEKLFEDLEQYPIECVVIDLFVHGENVLARVLGKVGSDYPAVKVITCSAFYGPSLAEELLRSHGRVIDALIKPVDLARLASRIESMEAADRFEVEEYSQSEEAGSEAPSHPLKAVPLGRTRRQALEDTFGTVCRKWPKDTTLIVHRPRQSRDPEFVLGNHIDQEAFNPDRLQLKSSPIGSVINDGETITISGLDDRPEGRGYYVRRMAPCSSMIGAPVLVMREPEYGLFVLRSSQEPFLPRDVEALEKIAWESHLAVERITTMETLALNHARLGLANLFAGVAHETGNAINAIVLGLEGVKNRLSQLENGVLSAGEQTNLASLLKVICDRGPAISKTLKGFLGAMSERPDTPVELYKLLHEVVEAVEPHAKMATIHIDLSIDPNLAKVKYPNLSIRQSVFNLVLNAIQQLQSTKAGKRDVTISGGVDEGDPRRVWVSVKDTGHGIHEELRERIFDAFFTTRPDGSGLGLYLTRWFAESLGGRVFVSKTVRFDGAEFRLELPYPEVN